VLDQTSAGTVKNDHFQISTVSRLTGLSVHTIRAWEKRYQVVAPVRTDTKRRLYTRDDIRKLALLRSLVETGHPIGSIAGLSPDQLVGRTGPVNGQTAATHGSSPEEITGKCRVLVVGEALIGLFKAETAELTEFEPVAMHPSLAAVPFPPRAERLDLILVETPSLFAETIESISKLLEQTSVQRALLVYGFAQRETLRQLLGTPRITAIRGPLRATELKLAASPEIHAVQARARASGIHLPPSAENRDGIPPQRFSREQLARLARISTTVQCECPQHLGKLLSDLTAFEQYSAECENRSPEDARIHAFLHLSTARARALLEDALGRVLESEGIRI
jgi:MerR family transcriptional regulator, light-induced transcriptional regulator